MKLVTNISIRKQILQNEELTLSILRNIDTLKTQKTLSQEGGYKIMSYFE